MSDNNTTEPSEHYDDPNRPGWCGLCHCAYPCPGSATRHDVRRAVLRYRDVR